MRRPINSRSLQEFGIDLAAGSNSLDTIDRILSYCRKMGFINGNVTDIQSLIEKTEGLELVFEDLGHSDASIEKVSPELYRIKINSRHPKRRQRFSMAHEYAHYQLHRSHLDNLSGGEQILHRSAERDPREYQANRFAAAILMPEAEFRHAFDNEASSASTLAEIFDVSLQATRMRAHELGIQLDD